MIVIALTVWAFVLIGSAYRSRDDDSFNRAVGWANILSAAIGAVGLALLVIDRRKQKRHQELDLDHHRATLLQAVLSAETAQRTQLLGVSAPSTTAAELHFERSQVEFRDAGGAFLGSLHEVHEYFSGLSPRRLVVVGPPGAGKTVLALELLIRIAQEAANTPHGPGLVPVRLSLPAWDTEQPFEEWVSQHLTLEYSVPKVAARMMVESRSVLPILDGLDEMDPEGAVPARARAAVRQLNAYLSGLSAAPLVTTCRIATYDNLPDKIDSATVVICQPLRPEAVRDYLRRMFTDVDEEFSWLPVMEALDSNGDAAMVNLLSSPWRVRLALTFTRAGGQPSEILRRPGESPDDHFDRTYAVLLDNYIPAVTSLYPDRRYADKDRNVRWLRNVAQFLAGEQEHGMSGVDIVEHRLWRAAGSRYVRALHFIVNMVLIGSIVVLIESIRRGRPDTFGSVVFATILIIAMYNGLAPNVTPTRADPKYFGTRDGVKSLAWSVGLGAALCAICAVRFGLMGRWDDGLLVGAVLGVFLSAISISTVDLSARPREPLKPAQALRDDALFGIFSGALFAVLTIPFLLPSLWVSAYSEGSDDVRHGWGWVLFKAVLIGLTSIILLLVGAFAIGIVFSLAWAIVGMAGNAYIRYLISAVLLFVRRRAPLRSMSFLEWCYGAGILRASGPYYQFRHRELQERLLRAPA
jgi:hypothetical protein